jgi:hypothetical protein
MPEETEALVQRWILAFCEMPIILDPALMKMVLDGSDIANREDGYDGKDIQGR